MKIIKNENYPSFSRQVAQCIRDGGVAAVPFDTVYGLVGNPLSDVSMEKIYKIKGRDFSKPVALVFSSLLQLQEYIKLSPNHLRALSKAVPGRYTFILPFDIQDRLKFSDRYQQLEKIGVRIPDNAFVKNLIEDIGLPIAATSANISGQENCWSADEFLDQIKNSTETPDYIIDAGQIKKLPPSEVIDISDPENPLVLRA